VGKKVDPPVGEREISNREGGGHWRGMDPQETKMLKKGSATGFSLVNSWSNAREVS